MVLLYAVYTKSLSPSIWFIFIWASYYCISAFQIYPNIIPRDFIARCFKFLILAVFAGAILKKISKREIFWFLFIGASSIILNAVLFPDDYGRYGGFYIDPNAAGLVCITGYALTYGIKNTKERILGQFIFSLGGFMTFSRTFILIWLLLNLIALKISLKNAKIFILGAIAVIILLVFSEKLQLNEVRFQQMKSIVTNEKVDTQELNKGSRTETWSIFYKYIADKPFFGNGFGSFHGNGVYRIGPHNTYLFIIGEAGIIALAIFMAFQFILLKKSLFHFNEHPFLIMLFVAQSLFLLTNHDYFTNYYLLFITLWYYNYIKKIEHEN
ncbi:MAG: O-antigen ligase family protein [Bacteroidota bacterium]|nr:O-antigen ligase family protein [Bacteroidota bacterium]